MIVECKKALLKSYLGFGLLVGDLLLVLLGRPEHFGYLDRFGVLVILVAIVLMMVGAILVASYLRCLYKINGLGP